MKNKFMKVVSLCLALVLCFGSAVSVSAAEVGDAVIDETQKGSLTIYKYDLTGSEEDGVWDSSYVSTGVADQDGVNEVMKNYALKGVEFSYLKIADIVQHTGETNLVEALYALDQVKSADFLKALGLENGAQRYTGGDALDGAKYYYQSDVLISALSAALTTNSTVTKNALERYAAANGAAAMPLTDTYGKTKAENLDLGLYLIVETRVPENVVSTTDPFLISLPMTAVNGTNAADGGTRWIYDVTVYPKNQTGEPSRKDVTQYFVKSSDAYNAITGTELGFVQGAASFDFTNETVSDFCRYSDTLFSTRVSVTLNQHRKDGSVKESIIDQSLFFEKQSSDKWLCYAMTAEDVMKENQRVRLTFKNGDTVLQTDFYDTSITQLMCPVVTAPEGKHFSGWVTEGRNEEGETVMNLVFQPDESGKVFLSAGNTLEPMTLFPLFE